MALIPSPSSSPHLVQFQPSSASLSPHQLLFLKSPWQLQSVVYFQKRCESSLVPVKVRLKCLAESATTTTAGEGNDRWSETESFSGDENDEGRDESKADAEVSQPTSDVLSLGIREPVYEVSHDTNFCTDTFLV